MRPPSQMFFFYIYICFYVYFHLYLYFEFFDQMLLSQTETRLACGGLPACRSPTILLPTFSIFLFSSDRSSSVYTALSLTRKVGYFFRCGAKLKRSQYWMDTIPTPRQVAKANKSLNYLPPTILPPPTTTTLISDHMSQGSKVSQNALCVVFFPPELEQEKPSFAQIVNFKHG